MGFGVLCSRELIIIRYIKMVVVEGSTTTYNQTPSAAFKNISHTHLSGSNGFLLVSVAMTNNRQFGTCFWGAQQMTQIVNKNFSGLAQRLKIFELIDALPGTKNIRINFSGGVYNKLAFFAQSFIGCNQGGVITDLTGSSSPRTGNIIVDEGSWIYSMSISTQTVNSIQIPAGTSISQAYNFNNNRRVAGAFTGPFSAGTIPLRSTASSNLTLTAVEIRSDNVQPLNNNIIGSMFLCF